MPTTEISTLSLHDALPICEPCRTVLARGVRLGSQHRLPHQAPSELDLHDQRRHHGRELPRISLDGRQRHRRSEEHTSELQSRFDLVCRLLLEKKKNVTLAI